MRESYQVIARRWRPQSFEEVVGQEHIVQTLKNAILNKRIAHAYLFIGPRGTGKTSLARIFAKALNATGGPSVEIDNQSTVAQSIMSGNCMDVIEIDGASNNSVDQMRALRDECQYAPTECAFKIYIIDEVHMLSTAAFNALLKTLEEPPSHVKFIFATTEAHKVLPTIVSRCQRFEFKPISESLIIKRLQFIADSEKFQIEPGALTAIARIAQGGMRDAQSALEQMLAFCGEKITEKEVLTVYGLASFDALLHLAKAIVGEDYPIIIQQVADLNDRGLDLRRAWQDLQYIFRQSLIEVMSSAQHKSELLEIVLSPEMHISILDALKEGEWQLENGLSEVLDFEMILLKAAQKSRLRSIDTVIQMLSQVSVENSESEKKN